MVRFFGPRFLDSTRGTDIGPDTNLVRIKCDLTKKRFESVFQSFPEFKNVTFQYYSRSTEFEINRIQIKF